MTETTLRDAIDRAQYIKFHDSRDVFVAWFGGHTFNVYAHYAESVEEVDVFSLYGEEGEGTDRRGSRREGRRDTRGPVAAANPQFSAREGVT